MPNSIRTFTDVACTACSCVCDDLHIRESAGTVQIAKNGCPKADAWFAAQQSKSPTPAMIEGKLASFDEAIAKSAAILKAAKSPLIYGLARTPIDGQRAANALAEKLGAVIDVPHSPADAALPQVGQSTCTLGEVKNRADLIVFWNCDPAATHPRFLERFVNPQGRFIRGSRTVLAIKIDPASQWESLQTLRLLLAGKAGPDVPPQWKALADKMKSCRFGVVYFDERLDRPSAEALFQLAAELNAFTRFYANSLTNNISGIDATLTWQTGYPYAVNFAGGAPRHNAEEFSAARMLARREIDAALILGSESITDFPDEAKAHLRSIPTIRLDPPAAKCEWQCTVSFAVPVFGINVPGTAHRMDGIGIPLQILAKTELPSEADVLAALADHFQLPPGAE